MSFQASTSVDTTETSSSGEPGSIFYSTLTIHTVIQVSASDALTLSGMDDEESALYGIGSVDLTGSGSNSGNALEQYIYTSDEHNALGCHYLDETGTEVNGSWSQPGIAQGTIRFSEDGSYTIEVRASNTDVSTGEYTNPELPKTLWQTYTILEGAATDCPAPGRSEVEDTEGPIYDWASSVAYGTIGGQIDPANPPSVIDGSVTLVSESPEATVTVTWHFVHDGPIVVTPTTFPEE
ncbi:MAG TPA: hypothetical protein VIF08_07810 [Candidatus Limnocylindrales bacterium]|jgi:hypothetical protein